MSWDDDDFDMDRDEADPSDDEFNEYEDERAALRGTSQCDNTCDPQCEWCLVAHSCPDECMGGPCPYGALDSRTADARAYELGLMDAKDRTKRKRFGAFVPRRAYLHGYEKWIRINDKRRNRRARRRLVASIPSDMPF